MLTGHYTRRVRLLLSVLAVAIPSGAVTEAATSGSAPVGVLVGIVAGIVLHVALKSREHVSRIRFRRRGGIVCIVAATAAIVGWVAPLAAPSKMLDTDLTLFWAACGLAPLGFRLLLDTRLDPKKTTREVVEQF